MQSIPLAVLKLAIAPPKIVKNALHAIHTACGIETPKIGRRPHGSWYCMQSIPLAVLKPSRARPIRP